MLFLVKNSAMHLEYQHTNKHHHLAKYLLHGMIPQLLVSLIFTVHEGMNAWL